MGTTMELGSALSMFLEKMNKDKNIVPCFNSFYESEYLAFLLVGQTEQLLNLVEAVHILTLVEQDFTVGVVDDCFLDNGR